MHTYAEPSGIQKVLTNPESRAYFCMDKEDQITSFLRSKKSDVLFFIWYLVAWSKILRAGHIDQSLFDPV